MANQGKYCMLTIGRTLRLVKQSFLMCHSAIVRSLYWLVNFLLTYWFISDVLPTLPRDFLP